MIRDWPVSYMSPIFTILMSIFCIRQRVYTVCTQELEWERAIYLNHYFMASYLFNYFLLFKWNLLKFKKQGVILTNALQLLKYHIACPIFSSLTIFPQYMNITEYEYELRRTKSWGWRPQFFEQLTLQSSGKSVKSLKWWIYEWKVAAWYIL